MEHIRPGQLEPNAFERAILARIADAHPSLLPGVAHLQVLSRKFTGVGSFTNFLRQETGPEELERRHYSMNGTITMPGVPNGMGAVLFCNGEHPDCLEIFAYDGHWDGVHTGFSIEDAA